MRIDAGPESGNAAAGLPRWVAAVILLSLASVAPQPVVAQAPEGAAAGDLETALPRAEGASAAGYFSATQVARGAERYEELCSECHTTSQFRGPDFEWRWRRQTAWQLYREIATTMPESAPGSLDDETYAAIVAYFLSLNDYAAGAHDLQPTQPALEAIALGAGAAKAPSPP